MLLIPIVSIEDDDDDGPRVYLEVVPYLLMEDGLPVFGARLAIQWSL